MGARRRRITLTRNRSDLEGWACGWFPARRPLPADRIAAILEDLGERIGAIHEAEVDAVDVTARAIGR